MSISDAAQSRALITASSACRVAYIVAEFEDITA